MITCVECNDVIVGEIGENPNGAGAIHVGGCPKDMKMTNSLSPFGARVTVDRKFIDLNNKQLDAIQRLATAIHAMDEELTAAKVYSIWPTELSEVALSGERPSKSRIEDYMRTTAFISDMASRGVRLDDLKQQLTTKQIALMQMLKNPEGRKFSTILRRAGVTQYQFDGWMKSPVFRKYVNSTIGSSTEQALLLSEISLAEKAKDGDLNSIKFLMEWQGKYNPHKDNNAADAMEFVQMVLATVQEVVGSMEGGSAALERIKTSLELKKSAMGIGQ